MAKKFKFHTKKANFASTTMKKPSTKTILCVELPSGFGFFSTNLCAKALMTKPTISKAKMILTLKKVCKGVPKKPAKPLPKSKYRVIIAPPVSTSKSTQIGIIFVPRFITFCKALSPSVRLKMLKSTTSVKIKPKNTIAQSK